MYKILEPLEIKDQNFNRIWLHPDIKDHFIPNSEINSGYDESVHRVYLKNSEGKMLLHLLVKSDLLENYWDTVFKEYFDETTEDVKPHQKLTNKIVKELKLQLEVVLLEDVWMPGGTQFCFTEVGKTVGEIFKNVKRYSFSPDCALTTDGEDWWFDT